MTDEDHPIIPEGWTYLIHGTNESRWDPDSVGKDFTIGGRTSALSCVTKENAIRDMKTGYNTAKGYGGKEGSFQIRVLYPESPNHNKNNRQKFKEIEEKYNIPISKEVFQCYNYQGGRHPGIPVGTKLTLLATTNKNELTGENNEPIYWYIPEKYADLYNDDVQKELNISNKRTNIMEEYELQDIIENADNDKLIEGIQNDDIDIWTPLEANGYMNDKGEYVNSKTYPICFATDEETKQILSDENDKKIRELCRDQNKIEEKDALGNTPLIRTIIHGNPSISIGLLNKGARIDIQDNEGNTPLMLAFIHKQPKVFADILKQKQDFSIKNNHSKNIHDLTTEYALNYGESVPAWKDMYNILLKHTDSPILRKTSNDVANYLYDNTSHSFSNPNGFRFQKNSNIDITEYNKHLIKYKEKEANTKTRMISKYVGESYKNQDIEDLFYFLKNGYDLSLNKDGKFDLGNRSEKNNVHPDVIFAADKALDYLTNIIPADIERGDGNIKNLYDKEIEKIEKKLQPKDPKSGEGHKHTKFNDLNNKLNNDLTEKNELEFFKNLNKDSASQGSKKLLERLDKLSNENIDELHKHANTEKNTILLKLINLHKSNQNKHTTTHSRGR